MQMPVLHVLEMPDFRINGTGLARATFLTVGEA